MTRRVKNSAARLSATVASLVTLIVSYWIFRWLLIALWEWQHEGRRIVFVFQQEVDAALLALLLGVSVFVLVFRRSCRNTASG